MLGAGQLLFFSNKDFQQLPSLATTHRFTSVDEEPLTRPREYRTSDGVGVSMDQEVLVALDRKSLPLSFRRILAFAKLPFAVHLESVRCSDVQEPTIHKPHPKQAKQLASLVFSDSEL